MTKQSQDTIKTIVTVLGVVSLIAGVAFAAGNYPTREEWDQARAKQSDQMREVKVDVSKMKLEQVRLRGSMDNIEKSQERTEATQSNIDRKLDRVLLQGTSGGRNRNR